MRILVAVLGARTWPYPWLVDTIKRTWASADLPGVETVFYSGGASRLERRGRDVLLPVSDLGQAMAGKSLAFFDYALAELEFDVLFRPNCSSYVDLRNLVAFTAEHGRPERWYAGTAHALRGPDLRERGRVLPQPRPDGARGRGP